MILPREFYELADPVDLARRLLGCYLVREVQGRRTAGRITETEAYWAPADRASHARDHRRTARTETMFGPPGTAYVYLIYGLHHLFNVVTGPRDVPHAVLIRALEPAEGLRTMAQRRQHPLPPTSGARPLAALKPQLSAGPGVLSQAMEITTALDGSDLTSPAAGIWIEDRGDRPPERDIVATPRVGIDYAGPEWVAKPWRFYDGNSRFVSKPR
jgi:DNA-3-methyladenine glycosylase